MAEINAMGVYAIRRCVNTLSLFVVNVCSSSVDEYFSPIDSLYVALLAFIVVRFVLDGKSIHLRLLNRVCLLFCNQRARMLFSMDQGTIMGMFSNLMLAVLIAMAVMLICDDNNNNTNGPNGDLRGIFEGMLYLYGDILDFTFSFGVFKITLCAFMVGLFLDSTSEPKDPVYNFCIKLFKIVSANLTSQGIDMLIQSTPQFELFECIICVALLRSLLPSMGSYFVYMAARRVYLLFPGTAPLLFLSVIWLDVLPVASREWVGELCCICVVLSIANFLVAIPIGGVVVLTVVTHYMDFALTIG
jgi:hypothetical protein